MATSSLLYLNELKEQGNYSWSDLSNGTGIPIPTLRNIFSGKTSRPSFEDLTNLIIFMGGDMTAVVDIPEPQGDARTTANIASVVSAAYESRIADIKENTDKLIKSVNGNCKAWRRVALILMAVFLFVLIWDVTHGGIGYIRY